MRQRKYLIAGFSSIALSIGMFAHASTTPVLSTADISGSHDADGAGVGAPYVSAMAAVPATAALLSPFNGTGHSMAIAGGGTSKAKAGAGHSEALNNAKITFPSGMGVDQTDPTDSTGPSTFTVTFNFKWAIPLGTTLGVPIGGTFSIPVGATVTSGGSASASANVHWDVISSAGVTTTDARAAYSGSVSWSTAGTYLSSLTAPAASFSPSSLSSSGVPALIVCRGTITFSADNGSGTTFVEMLGKDSALLAQDFPTIDFSNPANAQYLFEPSATFTDDQTSVPEPSCVGVLACVMMGRLSRRRR